MKSINMDKNEEAEELRELLWWAFREGANQHRSFIAADGKCLTLLDNFQDRVNEIIRNHKE